MSVDIGLIYRVLAVKLMNCSAEDINNRKMVILVLFFLLKLGERLRNKKYRTPENIASLKSFIKTDIMSSIDKNIELGIITLEDGAQLYKLTYVLYTKLYSYYEETEEVTDTVDQSIVTFVDEFQEQKAKLEQEIADRDKKLADKDKELAAQKAEGDAIIARLQAEIEELKRHQQ